MATKLKTRHLPLIGLAAAATVPVGAALVLGVDRVLGALTHKPVRPSFELHLPEREVPAEYHSAIDRLLAAAQPPKWESAFDLESANNRLFIGFHGLWAGATRYGPLLPFLRHRGSVLLAENGSDVNHTPAVAEELIAGKLAHYDDIVVTGFSLGTQTAVQFLRRRRDAGRPIRRAIFISGPASPAHVAWPNRHARHIPKLLSNGPLTRLGWRLYWKKRVDQINAEIAEIGYSVDLAEDAEGALRMPMGAVFSGVQLLHQGVNLQPGELADTNVLVIEHKEDGLIRSCYDEWREAAPNSRLVTITQPGHARFNGNENEYKGAIHEWLVETA